MDRGFELANANRYTHNNNSADGRMRLYNSKLAGAKGGWALSFQIEIIHIVGWNIHRGG